MRDGSDGKFGARYESPPRLGVAGIGERRDGKWNGVVGIGIGEKPESANLLPTDDGVRNGFLSDADGSASPSVLSASSAALSTFSGTISI